MRNIFKNILLAIGLSFLFFGAIIYRKEVSQGVVSGIEYCVNMLIPSLFPFMFLSSVLSYSRLSNILSKIFRGFMVRVLNLPSHCFCTVFFGLCFGYPVGAKLVASLYEERKISSEEKSRLMLYVINPGLPFCVLFVGPVILNSIHLGLFIFISTVVASLSIGIVLGFMSEGEISKEQRVENQKNIMEKAVRSTVMASVNMCVHVVIFSAFIPLLYAFKVIELIGGDTLVSYLFMGIDVVHGVEISAMLQAPVTVFCIGLSFGGLCVHTQVFSFFKERPVNLYKFYFVRALHIILSLTAFKILLKLFPIEITVASIFGSGTGDIFKGTALSSTSLLILICAYIYLRDNKKFEKKQNI